MNLDERLKAEQHRKLHELHAKLDDVLEYEPADSGSEAEDDIWLQANRLKLRLNDFFLKGREEAYQK